MSRRRLIVFIVCYVFYIFLYFGFKHFLSTNYKNSRDKVLIFGPKTQSVYNSSRDLMLSVTQSSVILADGSELNWIWEELENDIKMIDYGSRSKQDAEIAKIYTKEAKQFGKGRVLGLLLDQHDLRTLSEQDTSETVVWEDEGNAILRTKKAYFISSGVKFKLDQNFKIISGNKDMLSVEYNLPTQDIIINFLFTNGANYWSLYGVDLLVVDSEIGKTAKYFLPLTCDSMDALYGASLFYTRGAKFADSSRSIELEFCRVQAYLSRRAIYSSKTDWCPNFPKPLVGRGNIMTLVVSVILIFGFVRCMSGLNRRPVAVLPSPQTQA